MKKLLALLLAVVMLLSFAACSKDDDDDEDGGKSSKGISLEDAVGYLEEVFNADVDNYEKLIPQEILDLRKDQVEDYDELLEQAKEETKQRYTEMLAEFGDDTKVSLSYEKGDDYDEEDLEAIAESLEKDFELDADMVKAACDVTIELKIEGDEEDQETEEYVAVQIGNSWYLVDYYEIGDEIHISFLA